MKAKLLILVFPLLLILCKSLFAQAMEGKSVKTNVIKQEIVEEWQIDPQAFAKLFFGDKLTLGPPSDNATYIRKPEIKKKVIGSYIQWNVKYGLNPSWFGMTEEGRRLSFNNIGIYSLLGTDIDEFVGWIQIMGHRMEGDKVINDHKLTWGIPPNTDLLARMKINNTTNPVILKNGMLMIAIEGSELTIEMITETCDWPLYEKQFSTIQFPGSPSKGEVCVSNPLGFQVKAGVRSEGNGLDFIVPITDSVSVFVPLGRYEIYFQYSIDPSSLYQGDNFELTSSKSGIKIILGETLYGNYNIKKVK